jgi:hypothetical protein
VVKARLDSTILLLKSNLDSHLRLRFDSENLALTEEIQTYLVSNGIDREQIEMRDDGSERGVEAILIR